MPRGLISMYSVLAIIALLWLPIPSFHFSRALSRNVAARSTRSAHSAASASFITCICAMSGHTPILPATASAFSRYEDQLPINVRQVPWSGEKRGLGNDARRHDRAGESARHFSQAGFVDSTRKVTVGNT